MAKFRCGDTVKLKSGGPAMTVSDSDSDKVSCEWFDAKLELGRSTFHEQQLEAASPTVAGFMYR